MNCETFTVEEAWQIADSLGASRDVWERWCRSVRWYEPATADSPVLLAVGEIMRLFYEPELRAGWSKCVRCERPFIIARRRSFPPYCSYKCRDRARYRHGITHREIAERDGWRCHLCRCRVTEDDWSLDHLIPVSAGGPTTRTNLAIAHLTCNIRRGNRGPAQLLLFGSLDG